jgi:hypothetical protein
MAHNALFLGVTFAAITIWNATLVDPAAEPPRCYAYGPRDFLAELLGPFGETIILPCGATAPHWGIMAIELMICVALTAFCLVSKSRAAKVAGAAGVLLWWIFGASPMTTYY